MKTSNLKFMGVMLLAVLMCLPGLAMAMTATDLPPIPSHSWTQEFQTDLNGTNAIYIWMDSATPQVTIENEYFNSNHAGWAVAVNNPMYVYSYGPGYPANTPGIFVTFTGDSTTDVFSFQWAEVQWSGDNKNILGTGILDYSYNNGWTTGTGTFTHTDDIRPIPLPASALLLGSGLFGLGLLGWRRRNC
jgi:hypothetical protein